MTSAAPSTLRQRTTWSMTLGFSLGMLAQLQHVEGFKPLALLLIPILVLQGYLQGRMSVGRFWPDVLRGLIVSTLFWTVSFLAIAVVAMAASGTFEASLFPAAPLTALMLCLYGSPLIAGNALILSLIRGEDPPPRGVRA